MSEEGASASPPDPLTKLRGIVDAFPGQRFAVVDGGHFADLPAEFRRQRLFARSLFLDTADTEVQAAGPWLVALGQAPDATDKVFALVGDKPAAVFWCCEAGEMVLWRHLRGLNVARIPKWAADGGTEPPDDPAAAEIYEAVMFRHWDPRVLAALMPCLEAAQFSRIIGPGGLFAFFTSFYGGVKKVVRDRHWPPSSSGSLCIGSSQIEVLIEKRSIASNLRIETYLRAVFPEVVGQVPDEELRLYIQRVEATGRALALQLRSISISESMSFHDSGDRGWRVHRSRRRSSSGPRRFGR